MHAGSEDPQESGKLLIIQSFTCCSFLSISAFRIWFDLFFFFLFWWVVIREGYNPSAANSRFWCAAVYLGSLGRYLPVSHTSLWGRRMMCWLQDKEGLMGSGRPSCEHIAPSQVGRVLNSALNSVTKVLWHTFVPQLAGAQANMPRCCFST